MIQLLFFCPCLFLRENFPKSRALYGRLGAFLGDDLLTFSHGPEGPWKANRTLINPAFKSSSLRAMSPTFAQQAIKFTQRLLAHAYAHPEVSLNFSAELDKLTLNIISLAGFGFDVGTYHGLTETSPFLSALQTVLSQATSPLFLLPYGGQLARFLQRRNFRAINEVFYNVIDRRIQEGLEGKRDSERVADLLDAMLKPGDDGRQLTREELRNELLLFYLAGHDTTANVLNWALLELARHPDVHATVMDEIDSVMGPAEKDPNNVVCPTHAQLEEMPYLEMVLKETLRLYPAAPSVFRMVPETFEFKGMVYPKGISLSTSVFLIHRDPELWPEPEKFDPERFTKDNCANRHTFAFLPFSAGPRICIGKNFFYLESKILLVTLLRSLKFEVDVSQEPTRMTRSKGLLKATSNWLKVSSIR